MELLTDSIRPEYKSAGQTERGLHMSNHVQPRQVSRFGSDSPLRREKKRQDAGQGLKTPVSRRFPYKRRRKPLLCWQKQGRNDSRPHITPVQDFTRLPSARQIDRKRVFRDGFATVPEAQQVCADPTGHPPTYHPPSARQLTGIAALNESEMFTGATQAAARRGPIPLVRSVAACIPAISSVFLDNIRP